jgi:hypothetical protein
MGPHLHLDHAEHGGYLGFSHGHRCPTCGRKCNVGAGASKGARIANARAGQMSGTGTCSNCGKVYARKGRAQRFCSKSCYEVVAAKRAAKAAPVKVRLGPPLSTLQQLVPKVCPICTTAHLRKAAFCSPECAAEENVRRNRNYYRTRAGLPLDNGPSKNFVRPKR